MNAPSALRELSAGTQLAQRYTLKRLLGRGGLAETWLAADRLTGSDVALKLLRASDANRGLLREEWQTSIRLMHPHIVRVFEFHDDAAGAFYSLQPIDGPDANIVSGKDPAIVLRVVAAIADALRYAHGKGVVHRDIKAGNVLIDRNGVPYLIDFGVSARRGEAATGGSLVAASPATLEGEPAEPADDVFALGGLAWELISGRSPYSADSLEADIRETDPGPPRPAAGGALDATVSALIERMLDKDATARPTAEEVVEGLADAGIRPGAVPRELLGDTVDRAEEVIEAQTAARRPGPAIPPAPSAGSGQGGLSPRTVYAALGALVLVLAIVVFYLPGKVEESPSVVETTPDEAVDETAVPDEETAAEPAESTLPSRDDRVEARQATEEVLGRLLARMETLEGRAVQRWAGSRYAQAVASYEAGDAAYLERDYAAATADYERAIELVEPLLEEVDAVFDRELATAEDALANADVALALEKYDLAVAISPGSRRAQEGFERAKNLGEVLTLVESGLNYEDNLELEAAKDSFAKAVELDDQWAPAKDGLDRVIATIEQMNFDNRMSEGLAALSEGDYESARAAFRMAQTMRPNSNEPADGLLQVDQGIRLGRIAELEATVAAHEAAERWEAAVTAYEEILELDPNLAFVQSGLRAAQSRVALHKELDTLIDEPDSLSSPSTMQRATNLVVSITRMDSVGPRLAGQRDELSRLLKRAATPLKVQFVSDNLTEVSVYKVGRLGTFDRQVLELRPGTYVAVGSRAGYRDVRQEFRVAPELDMQPIDVRCEEPI